MEGDKKPLRLYPSGSSQITYIANNMYSVMTHKSNDNCKLLCGYFDKPYDTLFEFKVKNILM